MMLRKVQTLIPRPIIYNLNNFWKDQSMKYLYFTVLTRTVNLGVEISHYVFHIE